MATSSVRHQRTPPYKPEDAEQQLRYRVNDRLRELLPTAPQGANDVLFRAAAEALLGRGKRVRPVMTMLACEHVGGRAIDALDLGCAVEMIHSASLVLDDLPCMDNATLRRGAPTIHISHGEDAAILVAIALLNQAYAAVLDARTIRPEVKLAALRNLTKAVGFDGLSQGQIRDLRDTPDRRDENGLRQLNHQKTSALFINALESGGAVGGATADQIRSLASFGEAIGFAFQLRDDLMDAVVSSEETGKDERQDAGKITFLDLWGEERLRAAIDESLERAREAIGPDSSLSRYAERLMRNAHLER
ncbi:MAG: polyprenyl synthetase family protein [Alphaproteobacteria bacterium]|nr:polyprenyl synthetase family protein [Alphaproteobacteria bacterium]